MIKQVLLCYDYGSPLGQLIINVLDPRLGCVPEGRVPDFLFSDAGAEIHQLFLGLPCVELGRRRIEIRMLMQGISDPFLLRRAETERMVCQIAILAMGDALIGIVIVIFNNRFVKHL